MGKEILKATRKKIHHLYKDVLVSTWLKYFKVLEIDTSNNRNRRHWSDRIKEL